MTAGIVCLLLAACLCVAILVTWGLMPKEMQDQRRLNALGLCFYGGFAAFLSAAAARNGLAGVGLAVAGLIATFLLLAFANFLTPGSFAGILVVFGLLLLGAVIYSLYLVVALCLMGLGLWAGSPFHSWCDLLICIGLFEGLGSVLVIGFSWS